MASKKVIVVYASRKFDSNLFMASTIFSGLQKAGYAPDVLYCGTQVSCEVFKLRCGKYFTKVFFEKEDVSWLERICSRNPKLIRLYTFYREFVKDFFWRSYSLSRVCECVTENYDVILGFVPTFESGRLAYDIKQKLLSKPRLVLFWTDPLSLGRLDSLEEMPKTRLMHRWEESSLLKMADKSVFCYPLLCEMEAKLHPAYAEKMTWSDVGYVERPLNDFKPNNQIVTIGHFGAYQKRVRNIEPLLAALEAFPSVKFVFRGDSDVMVDPSKYCNLDIKPGRVPADEVEQLEAHCDALICLGGRSGITNPAGKVMYYASYNKPILYIGDGVHKDYFRRYLEGFNRYIICDNDVNSIVEGLRKLIAAVSTFKLHIPERMKLDVIAQKIVES